MNVVKVQYTVKKEYIETNKANIQRVIIDLKDINNPNIKYSAFLIDNGKSFVHFVMQLDDQAQKPLIELPSFQDFQRQMRESDLEVAPKAENLHLVGSSWDII